MSIPSPQKRVRGGLNYAAVRRSVTVPTKSQPHDSASSAVQIGTSEGIETLYIHHSARIVSFSSVARGAPSPTRGAAATETESGPLSWRSATERTIAVGLLEIYRVPGSVSFLHSGSLLHAILPRSQCWCVDGVSTFAFRVLPNQYYRIELPSATEKDLQLVEEMKVTLQKVLHYERTPCPFRRRPPTDLPEITPITARKKEKPASNPAKKWKLRDIWRPEDEDMFVQRSPLESKSMSGALASTEDRPQTAYKVGELPPNDATTDGTAGNALRPSTPPGQIIGANVPQLSPVTPAGAFSEDDIVENSVWTGISTPSLSSDSEGPSWGEVDTPPSTLRMRKTRDMTKGAEIKTPEEQTGSTKRAPKQSPDVLTDSIIRKTARVVLGPPANLVAVMLKIAASFSNGAFNFTIRSPAGSPQRVPGSWYLGDEDDWDLDEYGFTIGVPGTAQRRALSSART